MKKILWFSNVSLASTCKETGSWLHSMSDALIHENELALVNVTQDSSIQNITKQTIGPHLTEYKLPKFKLRDGLPEPDKISRIIEIVDSEGADLIHIWGTELYWGLLASRGYLKGNVLLEIQGLIVTCCKFFYGSLSIHQILRCITEKEIRHPKRSLHYLKKRYGDWTKYEYEIIKHIPRISVQSSWVKNYIQYINPDCEIYNSLISIREEFLKESWCKTPDQNKIVLTTISSALPYKGLNDIIEALYIVKQSYPEIRLNIIGGIRTDSKSRRTSGFEKLVLKMIASYGLKENINFCGSLSAQGLVDIYSKSDIFIQASHVESYSLTLAEAMAYGIPTITTYSSAMTELGIDNHSVLFYSPGDYSMCAAKICDLIRDPEKAKSLSENAMKIGKKRNDRQKAAHRQLETYQKILAPNTCSDIQESRLR